MRPVKGLLAGAIAIVILALVLPGGDDDDPPQVVAKGARPAAISTSGSFSSVESRGGMPVFTASNVGPGTLVEGTVTIANGGRATGYFSLSQKDLTDAPGPNGGALSQALELEISDVTKPDKPVPVYSGPFAGMGVRGLGFIPRGSEREYQFTATLRSSGEAIGGEAALEGSSASARFVWRALEGEPPKRADRAPAPQRDRRPPRLRVSIPSVQPLVTRRFLETKARCSEPCTLAVTGSARARKPLRAKRLTRVRVKLPRRTLRSLRRRLLAGRPAALKLKFTAVDGAENRFVVRRTVRLRPRRR